MPQIASNHPRALITISCIATSPPPQHHLSSPSSPPHESLHHHRPFSMATWPHRVTIRTISDIINFATPFLRPTAAHESHNLGLFTSHGSVSSSSSSVQLNCVSGGHQRSSVRHTAYFPSSSSSSSFNVHLLPIMELDGI